MEQRIKEERSKNTERKKVQKKNDRPAPKKKEQQAHADNGFCMYAKKCGGCDYQGISYEKQLKNKQELVKKNVGKFCKVNPIIGMEQPYHYRNKVHAVFDIVRGNKGPRRSHTFGRGMAPGN